MSDKLTAAETLRRETEAARSLLAQFADILGDDAEAKADAVEGETSLLEAINKALARVIEVEAMMGAIGTTVENLNSRARRLKEQRDNLRAGLIVAMELATKRKLETPLATLSLKAVAAKVAVTDETLIPSKFWKPQDPELDRKALLAALKAKEHVPGATLDNGSVSLQITPK